jgi:maleate isomerase
VTVRRIGLVVPSSNTTMEVELPELLRRREAVAPERFTCHASRVRMRRVTSKELAGMNVAADRCVGELADARCDALVYACLVAIMAEGPGAHLAAEQRLSAAAVRAGHSMLAVTSASALVAALATLGARRIALIAPYVPSLTATVAGYLAAHGVEVVDAISLGIADNVEVGRHDPVRLIGLADRLDVERADAVVLSACVQLPSLPAVPVVERRLDLPVLTAATATAHQLLTRLNLAPDIPDAGRLLAPRLSGTIGGDGG